MTMSRKKKHGCDFNRLFENVVKKLSLLDLKLEDMSKFFEKFLATMPFCIFENKKSPNYALINEKVIH